jgi:hypothetical protein
MENKRQYNQWNNQLIENINRIDKPLANLSKRKK